MLATVVYILISFIPLNRTGKSTFAYPIAKQEEAEIIQHNRDLLPDSHNIIIERNIFGSSGVNQAGNILQRNHNNLPTTLIKTQFCLLATIAGDDQVACAVIENLKSKVQDIYKAGDIINGAQIERIERNKIIFFCVEEREVLNLHITCSASNPVEKKKDTIMEPQQKTAEFVKVILPLERDISKKDYTTQFQSMHAFFRKSGSNPLHYKWKGKGIAYRRFG